MSFTRNLPGGAGEYPVPAKTLLPVITLLFVGCIIPMVILIIKAFGNDAAGDFSVFGYATKPLHLKVLLNTLRISTYVSVLSLILGVPLVFILAHDRNRVRTFVLISLVGSMLLSTLVRSYILTVLLATNGPILFCLRKLGLVGQFEGILFTRTAVILAMVYILLPYLLFIAYSSLKVNFVHLRNVALTQGATNFQYFTLIFLPNAASGLIFGFTGIFVLATSFYVTPELLGGGKGETMMLASLIAQQLNEFGDWRGAAVLSLLLLFVIFLVMGLAYLCWVGSKRWMYSPRR